MAFTATTQLAQREANLLNARAQQEYDRYIADLARQYGIAEGNLNANLEGRGIYRSGEAGTARTRLSAENQALRSAALQDLEYRKNMNQINLLKQLASLQASSAGQTSKDAAFDPAATGATKQYPMPYMAPDQRSSVTTSGMGSGRTPYQDQRSSVTSSGMGSGRTPYRNQRSSVTSSGMGSGRLSFAPR